jgi:Tfp pilus assembly protein PilN
MREEPTSVESQPPRAPIVDGSGQVDRAQIGRRWGVLFWLPIVLLVLVPAAINLSVYNSRGIPYFIGALVVLSTPLLVLVFAGCWWATRGQGVGEWTFLLAALAQGLALFVSLIAAIAIAAWGEGSLSSLGWARADLRDALIGSGICSLWTLALGAVIMWRVRRAENLAQQDSTPTSAVDDDPRRASSTGLRRFAVVLISSLGIPLLLCAILVLLLHYDASHRDSESAILARQIATIDAQITDLKDVNRVRAQMLSRKSIVEVIQTYTLRSVDALGLFGQLRDGVQVLSLDMREGHLVLALQCKEPASEQAILDVLAHSGYRDQRIAQRQREGDGERLTIEASSIRGDRK